MIMLAMIWDNLKVVLAISRSGSLAGAALTLNMDQSTVGRRLTAYEAELGTILFIRAKSGFVPTETGMLTIKRAHEVEHVMSLMQDELTEAQHGAVGTVRLMGNAWMLRHLAETAMADFMQSNPQIELRLASHLPPTRIHGDAAISLWFEANPNPSEFVLPLGQVPYAVYRSISHPPAPEDWVIFQDDEENRPVISRRNKKLIGENGTVRLTATDASILVAAVANGIGKALLPVCLGAPHPDLVIDTPNQPFFQRVLYMHLNHDTFENKRIQVTVEWLRKVFPAAFGCKD